MAGAADRLRGRCRLDGVFPEGEVVINIRVVQRLAIEHLGTGADVCELLRRLRTGETDERCLVSAQPSMAALMVVQSASMSQGVTFTPTVARREPCPRLVGGCLVARRSSGGSAAPPLVWTRAPSSSIGSLPVWTDVASRIECAIGCLGSWKYQPSEPVTATLPIQLLLGGRPSRSLRAPCHSRACRRGAVWHQLRRC